MPPRLLLDTDVIVDHLRGVPEARTYLSARTEVLLLSTITIAELFAGVREGPERTALDTFLTIFGVVDVDAAIAQQGGLLRRQYGRSHNMGLADALIAATAEGAGATLVTLNRKHFPMLSGVVVPYQKSRQQP